MEGAVGQSNVTTHQCLEQDLSVTRLQIASDLGFKRGGRMGGSCLRGRELATGASGVGGRLKNGTIQQSIQYCIIWLRLQSLLKLN